MKDTKKKLLASIATLVVCFAMLIGSTYAWFTDSASTGVNKIQAGNLDVQLLMWNGTAYVDVNENPNEPLSLFSIGTSNVAQNNNLDTLWEPGKTQVAYLKIKNKGNLDLKYSVVVQVVNPSNSKDLYEVMKYNIVPDATNVTQVTQWTGPGTAVTVGNNATSANDVKLKKTEEHCFALAIHMDETAGNTYKDGKVEFYIHVNATQLNSESDSFGKDYDKNAPNVYPASVTTESFVQAQSVYYYGTYGGGTNVHVATGVEILNHPAAVAYVDANGNVCYAADVYCAVANGATAIYCKENAILKARSADTNRTEDLTKDLTIYANGADFQYGEIALNSTTTAAQDIAVKVYDAKNLYIWGYSPAEDRTLNVLMENCHNIGISETDNKGRMFYISNNRNRTNGTIHATLRNCSVEKSDSPVYMNADGSLTLENCIFTQCAVPVNNNYKSAGIRTDVVKDCKFISCGCTAEMSPAISSYAAPIRFVKSGTGTLTVMLENNTFNGTIGTNGDILLGDYRTQGNSFAFGATIVTANPVNVKSSDQAAYSYSGGTVNVGNY